MPRYLVVIRLTTEYSREFTAKDEETAETKALDLFDKDRTKFDCEEEDGVECDVEEP